MGAKKKRKMEPSHVLVHKLAAGVCLLGFLVVAISGFSAGSQVSSMAYRMMVITLVVAVVSRVVITIFQHSEEMSSGKG